jgi:branched-chain amino acid transport system ATP-binding protein
MGDDAMAMLEVTDLSVSYGVIQAIKGVSFAVEQGEIISLIGANGAGKTTILQTISGMLSPRGGQVRFLGQNLLKTPGHRIVSMGMAHVPEGRRVFAQLTVLENLKLGAFTRKNKKETQDTLEAVFERFPRLLERQKQIAGTLSGGEQQMLAIGRALMSKPSLILMDEPSMGLSPILVNEIFKIIQEVSQSGTTVLLVEQNAKKALSISDRAYVLETGTIVLEGKASDLLHDDGIRKAYLGE